MRRIWWIGAGALAAIGLALAVVQAASLALFGPLGQGASVPALAASTWPFDVARATGLDRLAAVRVELARAALVRGEPDRAATWLTGLPGTPAVDDLRGQVALANGRFADAVTQFGAAGDVVHARATIEAVAVRDPLAAYQLAAAFARDTASRAEPAPVRGDAAWRAGQRAAIFGDGHPAEAERYYALAFAFYQDAVRDDPTQEAYLLALGVGALKAGDASASRDAFQRTIVVGPSSVDGYVGLAVSEARLGHCAASRAAMTTAQAFALQQHRSADAAATGYDAVTRAAFLRCARGGG